MPCFSSGPAACAAFPDAGSLGIFRSPGVCPSASLVTWVGFQPFLSFSMLLLLRLLAGVAGVVPPVSGCSRYGDVSLVWGGVTLLPFPYLRVGLLLACGFSGVRGSSRLWVRGRITGRWMFQVPVVFLYLTLGSSLSLPVLPARLRWLRFLLSCPPSVASLWRGLT